jgi:hypothetical protein
MKITHGAPLVHSYSSFAFHRHPVAPEHPPRRDPAGAAVEPLPGIVGARPKPPAAPEIRALPEELFAAPFHPWKRSGVAKANETSCTSRQNVRTFGMSIVSPSRSASNQ